MALRLSIALLFVSYVGLTLGADQITVCPMGCSFGSMEEALAHVSPNETIVVETGYYSSTASLTLATPITLHFEDGVILTCPTCPNEFFLISARVEITGSVRLIDLAISILPEGELDQKGDIHMSLSTAHHGINLASSAMWRQQGLFNATFNSELTSRAVITDGAAQWQQTGNVIVSGLTRGGNFTLDLRGGTWNQTGNVSIDCSGTNRVIGVTMETKWIQSGHVEMNVTQATGVLIIGKAEWQQTGQVEISLIGGSTGVKIEAGEWYQIGPVQLNSVSGDNLGISCIPNTWFSSVNVYFTGTFEHNYSPECNLPNYPTAEATYSPDVPTPSGTPTLPFSPPTPSTPSSTSSTPSSTPSISTTPSLSSRMTPYPTSLESSPSPSSTSSTSYLATPSPTPSTPASTPFPTSVSPFAPPPSPPQLPSLSASPSPSLPTAPVLSPLLSPSLSPLLSPSLSPSPSPSPSPLYLVSNTTGVAGAIPVLHFNFTAPDIRLLPKDPRGRALADAAVGVSLADGNIREFGGDEAVRYGVVESGKWEQVEDTMLGSTSSYRFKALLRVYDAVNNTLVVDDDDEAANGTRVEVQFYLFSTERNVSVGDLEFNAWPAFAKFTLRVFNWPWSSQNSDDQHTLEMRMTITPSFTSFTQRNNTPSIGVTSFALNGQTTSSSYTGTQTELKLIDTVELDGQMIGAGQGVAFTLEAHTSQLVMRFRHFNTSLDYDPDLGVILGAPRGKSSGSDNLGLIVGLAVAIPLAVVFVVVVIAAVLTVGWWRHKRVLMTRSSVNYDFGEALEDMEL